MLNVAIIMGRLVADPELRYTPNGIAVTSFTLAVNKGYAKQGEERQADFIDVVAWRNTAEFVCKYFQKGRLMIVEGSIQTRSYTDKNDNKRKAVEIVANNVNFGDAKRDGQSDGSFDNKPPMPTTAPPAAYSSGSDEAFEEVLGDDDLPF